MTAIGIDVGGTKIAGGLVERDGTVAARATVPTPAADGPAAILDAIAELAGRLRVPRVTGVGIGTGGVVDHAAGTIVSANGLLRGWTGTPVAAVLSSRLGLPVTVENDGNALALGELRFGAARGLDSALCVAVGTGVGGGVIAGGELLRGARHTAGEVGHMPVSGAEGLRCNCGRTGHLEAVASGPAMAGRHGAGLDLRAVAARALDGDERAVQVIEEGAAALGTAIAGLANALDPRAVIVGGGVAAIGDLYWTPLRAAVRAHALAGPEVRPAALRTDASIAGAAAPALAGRR